MHIYIYLLLFVICICVYIYIYIHTYICVCVCLAGRKSSIDYLGSAWLHRWLKHIFRIPMKLAFHGFRVSGPYMIYNLLTMARLAKPFETLPEVTTSKVLYGGFNIHHPANAVSSFECEYSRNVCFSRAYLEWTGRSTSTASGFDMTSQHHGYNGYYGIKLRWYHPWAKTYWNRVAGQVASAKSANASYMIPDPYHVYGHFIVLFSYIYTYICVKMIYIYIHTLYLYMRIYGQMKR